MAAFTSVLTSLSHGDTLANRSLGRYLDATTPAVLLLFPRAGEGSDFWNKTEIIAKTPAKNYTAYDMLEMWELQGQEFAKTVEMLKIETNDQMNTFKPPILNTYAFYGYGIPTPGGISLQQNFSKDFNVDYSGSTITYPWDAGDGLVTLRSTSRARMWNETLTKAGKVFFNKGYEGMKHGGSNYEKDYDAIVAKLNCSL